MKFLKIIFKTPLFIAVEKQNVEIVKILLSIKSINVNAVSVFIVKII